MNCNNCTPSSPPARSSFRPLTGMNCNRGISRMCVSMFEFPSPRGDELQLRDKLKAEAEAGGGFRPLAGMNCNLENGPELTGSEKVSVPSRG